MEFYKREFLICRICCGYQRLNLNSDQTVFIHTPTRDIKYIAQEKYVEAFEAAKDSEIATSEDMVNILMSYGIWSDDKEKLIKDILPEKIEELKIDIYKANMEIERREFLRKELRDCEEKLNKLFSLKHMFDVYTCSGIASITKLEYIINSCSKYEDGKVCDWDLVDIKKVVSFYNENLIDEITYRELAKTEPWKTTWSAAKKNEPIFDKAGSDMSEEQCRLISYSHFYDQIHEHPECPHESIIEDDDMLDGWLILQKRERDKEQNAKKLENKITNPKIANSQEIFLVAHNEQELKNINDLNSTHAKAIKGSRVKKVQEKGEALDTDFADVQRDIMMKVNQMERDKK